MRGIRRKGLCKAAPLPPPMQRPTCAPPQRRVKRPRPTCRVCVRKKRLRRRVLQRLNVQSETLGTQEQQARESIDALQKQIAQLDTDMGRETSLNHDAQDTIARLRDEQAHLSRQQDGHGDALSKAQQASADAATVLGQREADLTKVTEDVARLAARHQSADRLLRDETARLQRADAEEAKAKAEIENAQNTLSQTDATLTAAKAAEAEAQAGATQAEKAVAEFEAARTKAQMAETEGAGRYVHRTRGQAHVRSGSGGPDQAGRPWSVAHRADCRCLAR